MNNRFNRSFTRCRFILSWRALILKVNHWCIEMHPCWWVCLLQLKMASTKEKLIAHVSKEQPAGPTNKVTVVGVGMVGMAAAISVLLKVSESLHYINNHNRTPDQSCYHITDYSSHALPLNMFNYYINYLY